LPWHEHLIRALHRAAVQLDNPGALPVVHPFEAHRTKGVMGLTIKSLNVAHNLIGQLLRTRLTTHQGFTFAALALNHQSVIRGYDYGA